MMIELAARVAGTGRLALIGGGEFSFGETAEADRLWIAPVGEGRVGFLPTASGSADYGEHFAAYMDETWDREAETVPIYRARDAKRGKNLERIADASAVYIGGGVADELVGTLGGSPALEAIEEKIRSGGTVVAIAAAVQAAGMWMRSLTGREHLPGFGWLRGAVIEANFLPTNDHRLRQLVTRPGVELGIGLPAGVCLLIGGDGTVELSGSAFLLDGEDADLKMIEPNDGVADGPATREES